MPSPPISHPASGDPAARLRVQEVRIADLPGYGEVTVSDGAENLFAEEQPDTLVLVDCHRIDRTGPLAETLERFATRLCVDHHLVSGRRAPEPGWVEHDATAIWAAARDTLAEVVASIGPDSVAAIGITNQRETTVLWDRATGKPVHDLELDLLQTICHKRINWSAWQPIRLMKLISPPNWCG